MTARIGLCGLLSRPLREGGRPITTNGLTRTLLAEPFTRRRARRATIAIRERRRIAEYRRTEVCMAILFQRMRSLTEATSERPLDSSTPVREAVLARTCKDASLAYGRRK